MKAGRPTSHIFAIIFFAILALVFSVSAVQFYQSGTQQMLWESGALVVLSFVAIAGLGMRSKWAWIYCSILIAVVPLFLLGSLVIIVVKVSSPNYSTLLPSFVASILLLVLFFYFAFGSASKAYFNEGRYNNGVKPTSQA